MNDAKIFSSFFVLFGGILNGFIKEKITMIINSNAHDNPGYIIDYNVTSSLCLIRKIRFLLNRLTKKKLTDKTERSSFCFFIISFIESIYDDNHHE